VAPGAFRILASRDQAGGHGGVRIVVHAHDRSGVRDSDSACSIVANADVCEFGDARSALCRANDAAHGGLSQHWVSPKMAALRVQMGSIQATAADNPLLEEFSRLHRISVSLESGVLLARIGSFVFDGEGW